MMADQGMDRAVVAVSAMLAVVAVVAVSADRAQSAIGAAVNSIRGATVGAASSPQRNDGSSQRRLPSMEPRPKSRVRTAWPSANDVPVNTWVEPICVPPVAPSHMDTDRSQVPV